LKIKKVADIPSLQPFDFFGQCGVGHPPKQLKAIYTFLTYRLLDN